jgi:hypothetical protein
MDDLNVLLRSRAWNTVGVMVLGAAAILVVPSPSRRMQIHHAASSSGPACSHPCGCYTSMLTLSAIGGPAFREARSCGVLPGWRSSAG